MTDHAEIFLEEPESNLFPPTQFQLMDWIVEMVKDNKHKNVFFIATHSPYILNHLLQESLKDFRLYLTYPAKNGYYKVKTASEEDIQGIYDNGSDAFFNFEPFTAG
jgi:predicted ATPase